MNLVVQPSWMVKIKGYLKLKSHDFYVLILISEI